MSQYSRVQKKKKATPGTVVVVVVVVVLFRPRERERIVKEKSLFVHFESFFCAWRERASERGSIYDRNA